MRTCSHVRRVCSDLSLSDNGLLTEYLCAECGHRWTEFASSLEVLAEERRIADIECQGKRWELGLG